ncbi:hypothetical protein AB0K60_29830 [Thermopolyspora sp. NPDC052614]|uniref:hypothetical protein n=1 Tax=Thermopolyspora sp. NPDC052614 TaxID=3155682 RepID=UPI00342EFDB1
MAVTVTLAATLQRYGGRLVTKTSVQIGGRSCPRRFTYTVYNFFNAPPDEAYVTSSTADIRKAYRPLIRP